MTTVAHYELVSLLGRGGMGEVHLARDTRRGRPVALKLMDAGLLDDAGEFAERFRREGELLRSIQHRTLPAIYDLGVTPAGQAYLAMEYLRGEPLTEWIGRSALDTLPLLIQVCEGLREIAAHGVVHRDLSPDNILVVEQGRSRLAKIIDFGIAKEIGRTTNLTDAGYFIGKFQYCSPEHVGALREDEVIDWRSDLYSFGVVAYHVLSGRLPFRADSPVGYVGAHLNEQPRLLKAPAGSAVYPRRLSDLVARMLEKDRSRRPSSYDDVVRGLALAHAESLLRFVSGETAPPEPHPAETVRVRRTRGPAAAVPAAPEKLPLPNEFDDPRTRRT